MESNPRALPDSLWFSEGRTTAPGKMGPSDAEDNQKQKDDGLVEASGRNERDLELRAPGISDRDRLRILLIANACSTAFAFGNLGDSQLSKWPSGNDLKVFVDGLTLNQQLEKENEDRMKKEAKRASRKGWQGPGTWKYRK